MLAASQLTITSQSSTSRSGRNTSRGHLKHHPTGRDRFLLTDPDCPDSRYRSGLAFGGLVIIGVQRFRHGAWFMLMVQPRWVLFGLVWRGWGCGTVGGRHVEW